MPVPPTPAQGLSQGLMPSLDSTPSLQAELGPTGSCLERAPVPSQPALNSSPADFRAGWSLRLIPWGPRGLPSSEPLARGAKWGPMNYSETPDTQPERGAVCEGLPCRPPSPGRGPLRPPLISTPAGSGPELSAGRGRPPAGQQLEGSCPHSWKWQWLKGVSAGGGHLREGGSCLREDGGTSERWGAPQGGGGHLRETGGTSGHFRRQGGGAAVELPCETSSLTPSEHTGTGSQKQALETTRERNWAWGDPVSSTEPQRHRAGCKGAGARCPDWAQSSGLRRLSICQT